MLVLVGTKLKVRQEEHVKLACVFNFELVQVRLGLLHLLLRMHRWDLQNFNSLTQHCDVESLICCRHVYLFSVCFELLYLIFQSLKFCLSF